MVQRREDVCLALKPREPVGIESEGVRQGLQCDVATETCVLRTIDLAHPACTDGAENFVRTDSSARS
jgi:hypothetical protein